MLALTTVPAQGSQSAYIDRVGAETITIANDTLNPGYRFQVHVTNGYLSMVPLPAVISLVTFFGQPDHIGTALVGDTLTVDGASFTIGSDRLVGTYLSPVA